MSHLMIVMMLMMIMRIVMMIVIVMIRMSAVPHDNDDDDSDDQNECGTSSLRSLSSPVASWKAPPPLTTPCGQHVTRRNQTCEHLSERSKIVFCILDNRIEVQSQSHA